MKLSRLDVFAERRTRCALAIAASAGILATCGSGSLRARAAAAPHRTEVNHEVAVTITPQPSGYSLPTAFVGLAVEDWTLTKNQFAQTNLGRYMRALGPTGLLRIGGNSLDESFWTSRGERPPSWSEGTATPASLRALARALPSTGWRVILGVNLKHFAPQRAADEARQAVRILGPKLAAIEIGNEPDHYGISEATYLRRFQRYAEVLHKAVPGLGVVGPDAASGDRKWLAAFARRQQRAHQITTITFHNYPESACGGHRPTIADLLSVSDERSEQAAADAAVVAGRLDHVPAIIDETNSAVCWGAPGMSNVYASALWSLDYTLLLAQAGLDEVNFQGRIAGCTPYSPLCTVGRGHRLVAQPDFYGLLASLQVRPGAFLKLTNTAGGTLRAYAVQGGGGSLSVVLDNLGGPIMVALHLPRRGYRSGSETTLRTSSGRGLAATSGITLGGQQINSNGVLPPPRYRTIALRSDSAAIPLSADTAVILRIR